MQGCLVVDTALLPESEEMEMTQDHEVILADHRKPELGRVTGPHCRRCGSQRPGTGREGI